MRNFSTLILSCFLILFLNNTSSAQKEDVFIGLPIPTDDNMMFYIQKNTNPNTVVYALKLGTDGKINPKDPIEVFWRRYEKENGIKKKLGWIEKTFAFDFKVKPVKNKANTYIFSLIAVKTKKLIVTQNKTGKPEVAIKINGKMAKLERIFLTVDDSNKKFQSVLSIQLFGKDFKTGKLVHEKIMK